ncbi:hypothetical protein ACLKA6_013083 [Drosophila palustris]
MDILDIDEALKDDSYIFLADKTHDDISNILQQWKTNNQQQLQQSQQLQPHLHYNNHEQGTLTGSKIFKEHIGFMLGDLTPLHLGKMLDKYVHEQDSDGKMISVTGWYTVTIANCLDVPNSSIMLALKYALMPLKVQLFNFERIDGNECGQFLVDNKLIANRMIRLNGKVAVLYSNKVIDICVEAGIRPSLLAELSLKPPLLEAIKAALLARYDAKGQSLHLTRFHAAPELLGHFWALHVLSMLQKLLQMIALEFPQLRVLQLRDNYLCTLRAFDRFPRTSLPHLQVLDVSANNIAGMMELKNLRDMKLQTLDLTSNPLARNKEWQLRAMLPQVKHIRVGHNNNSTADPSATRYCGANSIGREFCLKFAKAYNAIFNDLRKRMDLQNYYDTKSLLSLSVPKLLLLESTKDKGYGKLYDLNQLQNRASTAACSKLFFGCDAAMHAICQLPEMQIDFEEAHLYIHKYNNTSRVFSIAGCFKELTSSGYKCRNYARQFTMRPGISNSWLIHNDMMQITLDNNEKADGKPKLPSLQVDEKPSCSFSNQLMELNDNFNNKMQLNKPLNPERSTPMVLPDFDEMPPLVKRVVIPAAKRNIEDEVDDTLLSYKHNSKTFTRPKRRSQAATNLETQFSQTQNASTATTHGGAGMLSLEIGGLVTTMHKSFLQDTSPPSSICSSMNNEHMNNSLITSADFTNLNFLQSTNSLEPTEASDHMDLNLTRTTETTTTLGSDVYTLSDMIRDRKALESLTMSGDGTLIKDSQIGQIDDISLTTLSKTASGCSTMDNSTDSVSTPNELQSQSQLQSQNLTQIQRQLRTTMLLSEEMIGDTTFSLVDSLTTPTTTEMNGVEMEANATFKRPQAPLLNETLLLAGRQVNTTFTEGCDTPEASRCETPENIDKTLSTLQMESTPLTTTSSRFQHYKNNNTNNNNNNNINNNNKQLSYTPTLKGRGEINISPIVSNTTPLRSRQQQLNHTYEPPKDLQVDGQKFVVDSMEMLEQIEQPVLDATYEMSENQKQMQCILDLAEAEVEMLAQQGDEEQFEHMLAELGKMNSLKPEQIKMQKSLDSIKRRFNKDEDKEQHTLHTEQQQQQQQQDHLEEVHHVTPPSMNQTHLLSSHSPSQSSSSGERLLSRRSRLYDDVNLSAMHDSNASGGSCNSTSFIVHRREEEPANTSEACSPLEETEEPVEQEQQLQQQYPMSAAVETEASSYKLTERRERDRERFKTIKITKEMRARDEQLDNIVVPCIDDEETVEPLESVEPEPLQRQQSPPGRLSRRDQSTHNYNNDAEVNSSASNNYLTYKKPKEKSLLMRQRQQQQQQVAELPANESTSQIARSLSRPRYISGLQKFTTVSKATSAGAGLNATTTATAAAMSTASTAAAGATTSGAGELKSPMGIKSKSFHNLSSNISGIGGPGAACMAPRPSLGGVLRRPSAQTSKLMTGLRAMQQQEDDTTVFKVPKLVSGLRAPATTGVKRAVGNGLARPSSGYYSLSMKQAGEAETPESLSSASSRGSLYGKDTKLNHTFDTQVLSSKLTQVTTGATGITKPSGLRQPTQMKRSGLPRPSSIVRR